MMYKLDAILTSCGRFDLLKKTLESFFAHFDGEINRFFIYDDYGRENYCPAMKSQMAELARLYPIIEWLGHPQRKGQIYALDTLWKHCTTEYVFQLEDDWEFYDTGFVAESIEKLKANPKVVMYWIRDRSDTNGHPINAQGILSTQYKWKGYSFNPSVKRLADYKALGSFGRHTKFNPKDPAHSEWTIGMRYYLKGYVAGILDKGYVKHIGWNRTVK